MIKNSKKKEYEIVVTQTSSYSIRLMAFSEEEAIEMAVNIDITDDRWELFDEALNNDYEVIGEESID